MLNEIWVTVFTLIKSIVGDVDVKNKGTLQKQIDDCFTSASNGKAAIASAITGKGVSTASDATFATMATNIGNIKTSPMLQAKNAALSTTAQTIKPDTGYDGLSQVSVPAVSGNAGTGDVLANKTFSSGSAGISKTGTMPNKGAWTGATTGSGNVAIPAGYHNGSGYVSGAGAYNAGISAADARVNTNSANYKGGYNAGVSAADGRVNADSANYKGGYNAGVSATKKGTAGAGDVLSGKTFTNGSSVGASGTMPNKGAWTGATTGSGNVAIPAGYHNGSGYVSGAGAYNAGVSATKKGTAGAGDVLAGKTFTNSSSVEVSGTMANKGSTTQDATAMQDDTYTYLTVPVAGYYNTASKLRTKNSNLMSTDNAPGIGTYYLRVGATYSAGSGMSASLAIDLTNVSELVISVKRQDCKTTICTVAEGQRTTISASLGTQIYRESGDTHVINTTEYSGVYTITIHCTQTAGTGIFLANIVAS